MNVSVKWNTDGVKTSEVQEDEGKGFTTDKNVVVNLPVIDPDEDKDTAYCLEEVKTPDGYNQLYVPVEFVIRKDGTVSLAENRRAGNPGMTHDTEFYAITIENQAGILMPDTGESGPIFFMAAGVLAMTCLLILYNKINKEEY